MNSFRVLPAGDSAVLIDLPDLDATLAFFAYLNTCSLKGVFEIVPAAKTILIRFQREQTSAQDLQAVLVNAYEHVFQSDNKGLAKNQLQNTKLVEIPVDYNGADLPALAEYMGISAKELIERHTGQDFLAAFAGFAPGFVYLSKGHPSFSNIPRLATPRTRVLPSSVAMAGDFSAIYPKESPGGWRLLGVTPLQMWNLKRPQAALIQPGNRVRFQDLSALSKSYSLPSEPAAIQKITKASVLPTKVAAIEVLSAGVQTLFQDYGRVGYTAMGVSSSGVLDKRSMQAANYLVGNPENTAVLENVMGGLQIRFHEDAVFAVTGADANIVLTTAAGVRIPAGVNRKLRAAAGNVLKILKQRAGMRSYIAVRGGFAVEPVLNSLATDVLAGIGPNPVRKGDRIQIASVTSITDNQVATSKLQQFDAYTNSLPKAGATLELGIIAGPRDDWFDAAAFDILCSQQWSVNSQSNRVGLRLQAPDSITRKITDELPSEGTVAGAIQVPASGQPVLFLADHPLTGGYPVIAVVASESLDLLGQVPIGSFIRFKLVD